MREMKGKSILQCFFAVLDKNLCWPFGGSESDNLLVRRAHGDDAASHTSDERRLETKRGLWGKWGGGLPAEKLLELILSSH